MHTAVRRGIHSSPRMYSWADFFQVRDKAITLQNEASKLAMVSAGALGVSRIFGSVGISYAARVTAGESRASSRHRGAPRGSKAV